MFTNILGIAILAAAAAAQSCSPAPGLDTPYTPDASSKANFINDASIASVASSAETPDGWKLVYQNKQAATIDESYQDFTFLATYDPDVCAYNCRKIAGCQSFNIFFERSPVVTPEASCPDPRGVARVKCSLFRSVVTRGSATNDGQFSEHFEVGIAGSNAYTIIPDNCDPPTTVTVTVTTVVTSIGASSSASKVASSSSSSKAASSSSKSSGASKAASSSSSCSPRSQSKASAAASSKKGSN